MLEKNTKRALLGGIDPEFLAEKAGTTLAEIEAEVAEEEKKGSRRSKGS